MSNQDKSSLSEDAAAALAAYRDRIAQQEKARTTADELRRHASLLQADAVVELTVADELAPKSQAIASVNTSPTAPEILAIAAAGVAQAIAVIVIGSKIVRSLRK